ncbi:MAG TPA: MFS transporter [Thermoleophilia bacterium]|nr:MFS transporter [Thermoleophilia bacterium]
MALIKRITAEDAHRRRWQLLALTSVGAFMWPLDGSIVSVALPVMGPDLHLSFTAAVWVSAAFLLTTAVLLIPAGRIADQRGRVRFYLLGIAVFTAASLLCALSTTGTWLIVSRIIQGGGAALVGATSAAIVTAVFPPRERGRALGINVMAVYIGLTVGPPLGGFIADSVGWRWIFLINIPIGVVVLLWGWFLLPRSEKAPGPRLDVLGSVLLGAFLICLLVPLTFSVEWGWGSPATIGLLLVSAAALVAFVVWERRVASPILDLDLVLKNRLFAAANTAALLNYMALYGVSLLTAIFLQLVQEESATVTGWLLLSMPLLMAVLSPFSGRLSDRIGSRVLATGGMLAIAAGMVLLALTPEPAPLWRVAASLAVVGVGMAAFSAPNTSAVMGSVRRDQLSQAGAFLGTMRTAGQALSVALLGGIAASQLGRVGGRLLLTHGHGGGELAARAVDAYAAGYRYAMLTGAALALAGAAVSLTRGAHDPASTPAAAHD